MNIQVLSNISVGSAKRFDPYDEEFVNIFENYSCIYPSSKDFL